MISNFSIENHSIHFWRVLLTDFFHLENHYLHWLNSEEIERSKRFRFIQHRQRFVIARGMLRQILSQYSGIAPTDIIFSYGPRGKPYLQNNHLNLQFNVSHSGDVAVYVITLNTEIGVDIQKTEEIYQEAIAKRFFSAQEYAELNALPEEKRSAGFCQLWACKEALIKAVGEGLYIPIGDFSVKLHLKSQWISLMHAQHKDDFYLENVNVFPFYCSAFATAQTIEKKLYWEWTLEGPKKASYNEE